jgi:hypothetical protein
MSTDYNIQMSRGVLALGGNHWRTSRFWWAADNEEAGPEGTITIAGAPGTFGGTIEFKY